MQLNVFKDKTICVAISGGVDSVCLLHKLKAERERYGYRLCAVHCEHGLRGEESKKDRSFVQALCKSWDVPLLVFEEDCARLAKETKQSVETAARAFRMRSYQEALTSFSADYIATAHHLGDEAETVLFRLSRGSSLSGAAAMKEQDGVFLRPLLFESKEEILLYAKENGLCWREDESNKTTDYTRNKLRLEVLPLLEKTVEGAKRNLAGFARIAAEDDEYLYRLSKDLVIKTQKQSPDDTGIRVRFCKEKPLFRRACVTALKQAGIEKDYTAAQLERLYKLQESQTGKKVTVLAGVEAVKGYDEIAFYKKSENPAFSEGYEVEISQTPPSGTQEEKVLRADGDKIPKTATIRTFCEGDEFKKLGGGNKKLKKYFIDEKIPQVKRKKIPLIAERDGKKVYAVCGVEISEEIKITDDTKTTVYIYLRKTKQGE